ncbi:HAD family hydrolase [Paenibacillus rigui]|uniref:HAD family hydrolase n=1 Tax=Paenibacillus rigui TaxID=554312 RepID=A0A229ULH1_9BACL|nr:HAD family hydrolase [Paenibacillus rigui]OXM84260.1 HAD family hydrolase [Paenibacillus rigui]
MIKLIVSDLDGTLMQKGHQFRQEDRDALIEAMNQGIIVCFASGRMYPEIRHVMDELELKVHSVSQNGAYVHTLDGKLIQHDTFETGLIKQLAVAALDLPFITVMCSADSYIVTDERHRHIQANLLAPLLVNPHAVEALGSELMCGKITYLGDVNELLKLKQALLSTYGDHIDSYIADVDCLDVMPLHVSKGTGIRALQKHLGIAPEETLCIGDSFNDVSMFRDTPHSFAMAGAHPDVKAKAAYEVRSVAEAVAWALNPTEAKAQAANE